MRSASPRDRQRRAPRLRVTRSRGFSAHPLIAGVMLRLIRVNWLRAADRRDTISARSLPRSTADVRLPEATGSRPARSAGPPAARAILAVRRTHEAADRRGAGGAPPGTARRAFWIARSAVLHFDRLSGLRRREFRSALELAKAADEYAEFTPTGRPGIAPGSSRAIGPRLRDFYELVRRHAGDEVLIDDRPVPFARELWLPLVWFLIR